jgi:hypothetical protein
MRALLTIAQGLAIGYVTLCAWLFLTQRSQIYFPVPETALPGVQSIRLPSGDALLKLWVVKRPGPRALLYFGGNAEDVSASLPSFVSAFPDHSLYLVNYRGYGGSTGKPSESALFADAAVTYDHVRGAHSAISVMGRSLGSGVAVRLASQREIRQLVLVTPYDSLVNVARDHYPVFPVTLLMRDRYDAAILAPEIRAPVLAVVAGDDEIIPRARSQALIDAFPPAQVQLKVVEGATHNTLDLFPDYLRSVGQFLAVRRSAQLQERWACDHEQPG